MESRRGFTFKRKKPASDQQQQQTPPASATVTATEAPPVPVPVQQETETKQQKPKTERKQLKRKAEKQPEKTTERAADSNRKKRRKVAVPVPDYTRLKKGTSATEIPDDITTEQLFEHILKEELQNLETVHTGKFAFISQEIKEIIPLFQAHMAEKTEPPSKPKKPTLRDIYVNNLKKFDESLKQELDKLSTTQSELQRDINRLKEASASSSNRLVEWNESPVAAALAEETTSSSSSSSSSTSTSASAGAVGPELKHLLHDTYVSASMQCQRFLASLRGLSGVIGTEVKLRVAISQICQRQEAQRMALVDDPKDLIKGLQGQGQATSSSSSSS